MFITNPEFDFWPWTWFHEGKECKSLDDLQAAWKTIDPATDPVFDPKRHNHTNRYGDPLKTKIANNIECVTHQVDVSDKISLEDYKEYAIKKFDQQMQKICNKHRKVVVGLSGGIDSTLTMSWLVNNKVDFESFVGRGDPWRGVINEMLEDRAIEMARTLGIKNHVINFDDPQFDKHDMILQYCTAEKYDHPCISFATQPPGSLYLMDNPFDGKIVAPVGIDDLLLHRISSWCRFIPARMMKYLIWADENLGYITDFGYSVGGQKSGWIERIDQSSDLQSYHRWADDLLFQMGKEWICSPAASQEWFETWMRIDDSSCDPTQLRDLMGVGWLKKQIKQWTPKDITSLILSSNCVENYYTPNAKNKEYLMAQCRENQALYKGSQNLPQQMYWRNTLEVIDMWHKVSPEAMHAVHVLNWIRKHR